MLAKELSTLFSKDYIHIENLKWPWKSDTYSWTKQIPIKTND